MAFKIGVDSPEPYVCLRNLLYDPEQDSLPRVLIPLNSSLKISRYSAEGVDSEAIAGFSFYNREFHYLFQCNAQDQAKVSALTRLLCQLVAEQMHLTIPIAKASKDDIQSLCPYANTEAM